MERESDLATAFVHLADSLVIDYDPLAMLQQLVDDCVRLLDVSAAGLLFASRSGQLQVAAASSEQMRVLEVIQLHGEQGPGLQAFSRGERVVAGSPAVIQRRWADFATDVSAADFRSVAAVPLRLREHRIGALDLFSDREGLPTPADVDIAQAFADIATIAILQRQAGEDAAAVSAQLQQALDSRVLIEQAKGVLATQLGITVADAFGVIRDHACARGLTLSCVAQTLIEGELRAQDLQLHPVRRTFETGTDPAATFEEVLDPDAHRETSTVPAPRQVQALQAVASAADAMTAAADLGVSLAALAQDLVMVRAHYGVGSTRAALRKASSLGHIHPQGLDESNR